MIINKLLKYPLKPCCKTKFHSPHNNLLLNNYLSFKTNGFIFIVDISNSTQETASLMPHYPRHRLLRPINVDQL